jgi:tetratricopeptide (TPR) repeat protein
MLRNFYLKEFHRIAFLCLVSVSSQAYAHIRRPTTDKLKKTLQDVTKLTDKPIQKPTPKIIIKDDPKKAVQKKSEAIANQKLSALEEAVAQENFLEADQILQTLKKQDIESSPRLLVFKGLISKAMYRPEDAYQALRAALKLDENNPLAQFEMALILMERKQWNDAETLLRLSALSEELDDKRRQTLSYYLGVIAFETGRLFEARSSFLSLSWSEALDPAVQQSTGAFLSKISKERPWTIISPLSVQYEANALGLSRTSDTPQEYSGRGTVKLIGGLFGNLEGLGGATKGSGPWGLGLRLLAIQNLDSDFSALNIQFIESEFSWSKLLKQNAGFFKFSLLGNFIRAGARPLSSTVAVKGSVFDFETSVGLEKDLQGTSDTDRTSLVGRVSREQVLMNQGRFTLNLPFETGMRLPIKKNPGEKKFDASLSPGLSWAFSKRLSLKLTEKVGVERNSSQIQGTYFTLKSTPALNFSYMLKPYLILSANTSFEWQQNLSSKGIVQSPIASASVLGIL